MMGRAKPSGEISRLIQHQNKKTRVTCTPLEWQEKSISRALASTQKFNHSFDVYFLYSNTKRYCVLFLLCAKNEECIARARERPAIAVFHACYNLHHLVLIYTHTMKCHVCNDMSHIRHPGLSCPSIFIVIFYACIYEHAWTSSLTIKRGILNQLVKLCHHASLIQAGLSFDRRQTVWSKVMFDVICRIKVASPSQNASFRSNHVCPRLYHKMPRVCWY